MSPIRCRLLCHDLNSIAELFGDDAAFYRNSSRTASHVNGPVARTLDTAKYPDTYMPIQAKQTQRQSMCILARLIFWLLGQAGIFGFVHSFLFVFVFASIHRIVSSSPDFKSQLGLTLSSNFRI